MTAFPSPPPSSDDPSLIDTPSDHDRAARVMVMTVHGLYLASLVVPVIPLILGVVLAYSARRAAAAPWRGHFQDAIATYWTCLLLVLIGVPLLMLFLLGIIPMAAAVALLAYKATRGLLRARAWRGV